MLDEEDEESDGGGLRGGGGVRGQALGPLLSKDLALALDEEGEGDWNRGKRGDYFDRTRFPTVEQQQQTLAATAMAPPAPIGHRTHLARSDSTDLKGLALSPGLGPRPTDSPLNNPHWAAFLRGHGIGKEGEGTRKAGVGSQADHKSRHNETGMPLWPSGSASDGISMTRSASYGTGGEAAARHSHTQSLDTIGLGRGIWSRPTPGSSLLSSSSDWSTPSFPRSPSQGTLDLVGNVPAPAATTTISTSIRHRISPSLPAVPLFGSRQEDRLESDWTKTSPFDPDAWSRTIEHPEKNKKRTGGRKVRLPSGEWIISIPDLVPAARGAYDPPSSIPESTAGSHRGVIPNPLSSDPRRAPRPDHLSGLGFVFNELGGEHMTRVNSAPTNHMANSRGVGTWRPGQPFKDPAASGPIPKLRPGPPVEDPKVDAEPEADGDAEPSQFIYAAAAVKSSPVRPLKPAVSAESPAFTYNGRDAIPDKQAPRNVGPAAATAAPHYGTRPAPPAAPLEIKLHQGPSGWFGM